MHQYSTSKYSKRIKSKNINHKKSVYKFSNTSKYQPSKALKQKKWNRQNDKRNTNDLREATGVILELIQQKRNCGWTAVDTCDEFKYFVTYADLHIPREKYLKELHSKRANYERHKFIGTLQIESYELSKPIPTALRRIIEHNFLCTNDKIQWSMNTYNEQCLFWWNVLDKLGVINDMVYSSYLRKCGKDWSMIKNDSGFSFRFISQEMIYSDHLFYILSEIEKKAQWLFNKHYSSSNKVIMSTDELIHILDCYNNNQIGIDICGLIATFTATKTSNALSFLNSFTTSDVKGLRTHKENICGHHIIVTHKHHYSEEYRSYLPFGSTKELVRKIYDGRDITPSYFYVQTLFEENADNTAVFKEILCVVWHKIREICITNQALSDPTLIYRMLMYYIDNIEIFDGSFSFTNSYKWKHSDYQMWCDLYKNVKSTICKNILLLISNELRIADTQRQNFMNLVQKNLIKNMSAKNVKDFHSFCGILSNSFYFQNMKPNYGGVRSIPRINGWFRGCGFSRYFKISLYRFNFNPNQSNTQVYGFVTGYVKNYKRFWTNIWKQIKEKQNINEAVSKYKFLYKLMLDHANIYLDSDCLKEFILNDILPILLQITNKDADSVQINTAIQILENHNFVYTTDSLIENLPIAKLNRKSLNLKWRFEENECEIKNEMIMCGDMQWNYGAQKYNKRKKSKRKQERKKLIKFRKANQGKQIMFEGKSMIWNDKRKKELQRMKWIKYNNKKRGKNSDEMLKYIKFTISESNCVVCSV